VLLSYCKSGNGVANGNCQHIAGADKTVAALGLLKMTQKQVNELFAAKDFGMDPKHLQDNYVYLVDDEGNDASFKGFNGNINSGVTSPYKVCTVHTAADRVEQETQPPETGGNEGTEGNLGQLYPWWN
jgi:hypothetical protein